MITVTGRVLDEERKPLSSVKVVALGDWLLTSDKLAKPVAVDDGGVSLLKSRVSRRSKPSRLERSCLHFACVSWTWSGAS